MLIIKNQNEFNQGFTLIELMAVVAIMAILVSAIVINMAGQREARDIKIAENLLVSNIRMVQSYTLSDRVLPNGQPAQFYTIKFDLSKPTQYTIEAIYNVNSSPQMQDIQTVQLPNNIRFAAVNPPVYPVSIDRSPASDGFASGPNGLGGFLQPVGTNGCALIAFAAPFGKIIFNADSKFINGGACNPANPGNMPYTVVSSDDYQKIINFRNNLACDVNDQQPPCTASTDSIMTIVLTNASNTLSKTVTVNAVTGSVSFN